MKGIALLFILLFSSTLSFAQDPYEGTDYSLGEIIISEDFSRNCDWEIGDYEKGKTEVSVLPGFLVIDNISNDNSFSYVYNLKIDKTKDFVIETKLMLEYSTGSSFSFFWGANKSAKKRFQFSLFGNFKCGIYVIEKDKYYEIPSYRTWVGEFPKVSNKQLFAEGKKADLKIFKTGDEYYFVVNGVVISKTAFTKFYGNNIGFHVPPMGKLYVDYIKIYYLEKRN